LKRLATVGAISFWFALEMHHRSALGAKFTFAGKYYAALTNLADSTRDLHLMATRNIVSTLGASQAKSEPSMFGAVSRASRHWCDF
jgi:hypothetical protein